MRTREENNLYLRLRWVQRQSMLATLKLEQGCMDCGYNERPEALQFDHVRGEKRFCIALGGASIGFERLLEEVEKCDVVCANCHSVRTHARRPVVFS